MKRPYQQIAIAAAALLLSVGPAMAAEAKPKKVATECESSTASRIQRSKTVDCPKATQPTRTITKEELDSTGQTDIGEALKRLDPRFH